MILNLSKSEKSLSTSILINIGVISSFIFGSICAAKADRQTTDDKTEIQDSHQEENLSIRSSTTWVKEENIEHRMNLQLILLKIPTNTYSSFRKLKNSDVTNEYISELRKLNLIKQKAPEIFKTAEFTKMAKEEFQKLSKFILENNPDSIEIPTYIIKHFIFLQVGWQLFAEKYGLNSADVKDSEVKHILSQNHTETLETDEDGNIGFILSEIVLDPKYKLNDPETNSYISFMMQLLQSGQALQSIAMSFSSSSTKNAGGQIGFQKIATIDEDLLAKLSQVSAPNMIVHSEDRGVVLYVLHKKIDKNDPDFKANMIQDDETEKRFRAIKNAQTGYKIMQNTYRTLQSFDMNEYACVLF